MARSNVPSDVFKSIDTHGNDPDVCWEWTGYLSGSDGRGYFTIDKKRHLAHRYVFEMFNGPIPDKQVVRHKCNNPKCCNPEHLQLGTQGDNEEDKYTSDRWGYTKEMVLQMRRYSKMGMSYRAIADRINKEFDVQISFSGVGKVIREETRKKG